MRTRQIGQSSKVVLQLKLNFVRQSQIINRYFNEYLINKGLSFTSLLTADKLTTKIAELAA